MPTLVKDTNFTNLSSYSTTTTYEMVDGVRRSSSSSGGSSSGIFALRVNKSWVRTPNYRQKLLSGTLPMNPFSLLKYDEAVGSRVSSSDATFTYTNANNWRKQYRRSSWAVRTIFSPFNPQTINLVNREGVVSLLNSKLKGAEWSAPVFAGEARETGQMVLALARNMATAYTQLRKGNFAGFSRTLGLTESKKLRVARRSYERQYFRDPTKASANALLQTQYGWIPLFSDVYDAARAVAERVTSSPSNDPIRTSAKLVGQSSVKRVAPASGYGNVQIVDTLTHIRRFVVYHYPTALDAWGSFGLLNPLSVIWELMPLSFVVDWTLPLGNYLEHLDTGLRFSFVKGIESNVGMALGQVVDVTPVSGVWDGRSDSYLSLNVQKTVLSSIPTPQFKDIRPQLGIGASQVVSGLALARQILPRYAKTRTLGQLAEHGNV